MKTTTAEDLPIPVPVTDFPPGVVVPIQRGRVGRIIRETLLLMALLGIGLVGGGVAVAHITGHHHPGCTQKVK